MVFYTEIGAPKIVPVYILFIFFFVTLFVDALDIYIKAPAKTFMTLYAYQD